MMSVDTVFDTLPKNIQRLIDEAFKNAVDPNNTSASWATLEKPAHPIPEGGDGGFIPDDNQDNGACGGGFLVEDTEPRTSNPPQEIPFDRIPFALQLLDLPPDDEEILAVLSNAASGWTSASIHPSGPSDPEARYVSREDWRSVCAVLLENRVSDIDEDRLDDSSQYARNEEDEDVSMNDDYDEAGSVSDGDSDDEYQDEYYSSRSRRGKALLQKRHLSPLPKDPQKPTSRQKQTCLEAFALFFSEASPEDLPKQRILISDLQRVSKLLGEKTKADELVEMLEMFSTSRDKAMSFDDFTRMMITAKLA